MYKFYLVIYLQLCTSNGTYAMRATAGCNTQLAKSVYQGVPYSCHNYKASFPGTTCFVLHV